jgi:hypothetical protein
VQEVDQKLLDSPDVDVLEEFDSEVIGSGKPRLGVVTLQRQTIKLA